MNKQTRRDFMKLTSAATLYGLFPKDTDLSGAESHSSASVKAVSTRSPIVYENNLRDRLWMWGHVDSDQFNKAWGIPLSKNSVSLADAVDYMGIPNVCAICGVGSKKFREQFKKVKRVTWTICPGNNKGYQGLKKPVFDLFDELPNLTGVYLDDFYRTGEMEKIETSEGVIKVAPAALSLAELTGLYNELKAQKRTIELGIVFYTRQLSFGKTICPSIQQSDFVSFWTWSGPDLMKMEDNFREYRKILPEKRTVLGVYMWDFANKKPLDLKLMKHQLDLALRLFENGEIEGMIFHCTPLCNKDLEAVEYSKKWITEHSSVVYKK